MKRISQVTGFKVASLLLAFVGLGAGAQNSTTSTTTSSVLPAPASPWTAGVKLQLDRNAKIKDAYDQNSNIFDRDASYAETQLHLSGGYKFSNGASLSAIQRMYYSNAIRSERQDSAEMLNLRLQLKHAMNVLGGEGALVYRFTLPTTQIAYQDNYAMGFAAMPALSWTVAPKWTVSYGGYYAVNLYGGNRREPNKYLLRDAGDEFTDKADKTYTSLKADGKVVGAALDQQAAQAGQKASNAYIARKMSENGPDRGFYYVQNGASLGYSITDSWSVSQSLAYSFGAKKILRPVRITQSLDVSTELGWKASKQLNVAFSINQGAALQAGAVDLITSKPLFYREGFSLYLPEQTGMTLVTSYTF
jgi:hypothetical protein